MAHRYTLSKELRSQLDELRDTLTELGVAVEQATTAAREEYESHDGAWNEAAERWQESERGAEVAEWYERIEAIADTLDTLGDNIDSLTSDIGDLGDKP